MSRWYAPGCSAQASGVMARRLTQAFHRPSCQTAPRTEGALAAGVRDDRNTDRQGQWRCRPGPPRPLPHNFLLEVGPTAWLIQIFEGRIVAVTKGPFVTPSSAFALRAPSEEWEKFWSRRPPPGSNDLMALVKRRVLK